MQGMRCRIGVHSPDFRQFKKYTGTMTLWIMRIIAFKYRNTQVVLK